MAPDCPQTESPRTATAYRIAAFSVWIITQLKQEAQLSQETAYDTKTAIQGH